MFYQWQLIQHAVQKADPAPAHRARPNVWKFLRVYVRVYFWKFRFHYTHQLYCNQHAVFTICILFSTLTTKAKGMCKGASKQSPDLKIIPPGSQIPGSANVYSLYISLLKWATWHRCRYCVTLSAIFWFLHIYKQINQEQCRS